jgi:hypothetical protein
LADVTWRRTGTLFASCFGFLWKPRKVYRLRGVGKGCGRGNSSRLRGRDLLTGGRRFEKIIRWPTADLLKAANGSKGKRSNFQACRNISDTNADEVQKSNRVTFEQARALRMHSKDKTWEESFSSRFDERDDPRRSM